MSSSPSCKRPRRRRGFTIAELLAPSPEKQQGGSGAFRAAESFIEQLDSSIEHSAAHRVVKWHSRFMIKDLPADPEALLAGVFQACVDSALKEALERGVRADHVGCIVSSELLDPDVWIGISPLTDNTVDAILNRFLLIAQSKQQQGVTLWGEPFVVKVTAVQKENNGVPMKRQLIGGAPRKMAAFRHRIHDNCLIKIRNEDNSDCLFYALQATFVKMTEVDWDYWKFYDYMHGRRGMRGRLHEQTRELMHEVGADRQQPQQNGYDAEEWVPKVVEHWNARFAAKEQRFRVYIFGSSGNYKPLLKFGPDDFNVVIPLFYDNNHFDGINRLGGLFGAPYCLACEKPVKCALTHSTACRARCVKCSRMGWEHRGGCKREPAFPITECTGCQKTFYSKSCFDHHKRSGFCKLSKQCKKCGKIWRMDNNTRGGRKGHVCGEQHCATCHDYHRPDRGCFISPLEPKKPLRSQRFVAFDLETKQHRFVDAAKRRRVHDPNFIAARVACPACIASGEWRRKGSNCKVCGPHRLITFSERPYKQTECDRQEVSSDPLHDFVQWLLYESPCDTIAYSHFGGRFDMVILFKELYLEKLNPMLLKRGNRLYEMKAERRPGKNPTITFRDSFNLMPMSLAALVPAFGLDVQDKPFFPHLANREENYGSLIFPDEADYMADGMMPAKREQFMRWFEEHKEEPFALEEMLASYCINDVEILMSALVEFRREFMEVSKRPDGSNRAASNKPHDGIDILESSITIASGCMRHYRANHLKANHLGIVPERGYDGADNQSRIALQFLQWYGAKHNVSVQTAHSEEGEKRVGNYQLDGWVEDQQLGIEVNGCPWHGCPKCFPDDQFMLPTGKTAGRQRELDGRRADFIRSQIGRLDVYWTCEIEEMLQKDRQMREAFDAYEDDGPLHIRSCFYGGRTGVLKMFHAAAPRERIAYFDVTSMYPFICSTVPFPVKHPIVHKMNKTVDWRQPSDNPYKVAIIKCQVVPPRHCDVPVLPMKLGGKDERLLFPLCAACARRFPEGAVDEHYSCSHSDAQRSWTASCTSLEIEAALAEGYRVTKLFRVLEYEQTDDQLFVSYMMEFMLQKIHSSDFDETIRGDPVKEERFIDECLEQFGMRIDRGKMKLNKGKRLLAKLALNNLWGRFSLRNIGYSESVITDDPAVTAAFLDDRSKEVTDIDILDDDTVLISFVTKKEFVEEHSCSNVIVSIWCTSAARLHLLKAMQKVARAPGCRLLYTDTDSLIYSHPEEQNPLELGPHLGQFTDEYPQHDIMEFCSGGSKQYGIALRSKSTGQMEYVLKVRGLTLNYDVTVNQGLRYETFKERVLRYAESGGASDPMTIIYPNFLRPNVKQSAVCSQPLQKIYRPFVSKGVVRPSDYTVLPFGFISSS